MVRKTDKLQIDVILETKKGLQSIKNLTKQVRRDVQTMNSKFKKLNTRIKTMGQKLSSFRGLVTAAFSVVAIKSFIDASNKQEDAINNLNAALRLTNQYSEEASKELQQFASEMQRLTTEGDEATLANQTLLLTIGKLAKEDLPRATKAGIGLSRVMRVDAKTAFLLLARAAQGATEMFSRYGITLDETMTDQEKFNEILNIGTKGFSLAQAEIKTTSGKMKQLANTTGDAKEEIGALVKEGLDPILPALAAIVKGIAKGLNLIVSILAGFGGIIFGSVKTLLLSINNIVNNTLKSIVLLFQLKFKQAAEASKKIITDPINEFKKFGTEAEIFFKKIFERIKGIFKKDELPKDIDDTNDKIKTLQETFKKGEIVKELRLIKPVLKEIRNNIELNIDAINTEIENWQSLGETVADIFHSSLSSAQGFFAGLIEEINRLARVLIARAAAFAILQFIPGVGSMLGGFKQFVIGGGLGLDMAPKQAVIPNVSNSVTLNINSSVNKATRDYFRKEFIPMFKTEIQSGRLKFG